MLSPSASVAAIVIKDDDVFSGTLTLLDDVIDGASFASVTDMVNCSLYVKLPSLI